MRISDDRYHRDRLRLDLALRMVGHGARTRTICGWTGLSRDRLRKLCRAYQVGRCTRQMYRLRARMPHHPAGFLRSSMLGFEASTLASLFYLLGLIPPASRTEKSVVSLTTLRRCETFCEAYEIYLSLYPPARLSFEQAWSLLSALVRRDSIKLNACGQCGRYYLTERVRLDHASCGCGKQRMYVPRRRHPLSLDKASNTPPSRRTRRRLQETALDEGDARAVAHDDVVEDADVDQG